MRIFGFTKKWDKLSLSEFTTFRYPRGDSDWYINEQVKVVFQPRRKGGGEVLGIAEIIKKELREFDEEYLEMAKDDTTLLVTDTEAIVDGFKDRQDMVQWLEKTYGRLDWIPRMHKLTLRWIR